MHVPSRDRVERKCNKPRMMYRNSPLTSKAHSTVIFAVWQQTADHIFAHMRHLTHAALPWRTPPNRRPHAAYPWHHVVQPDRMSR
jgi:hypothetical protein